MSEGSAEAPESVTPPPGAYCLLCKRDSGRLYAVPVAGGLSTWVCEECRDTARIGVAAFSAMAEFGRRVLKK